MKPMYPKPSNSPDHHAAHSDSTELDDMGLIAFLKQHEPIAPLANPDLEDSILQAVKTHQAESRQQRSRLKQGLRWGIVSAIAASCITTWAYTQRQTQIAQETDPKQLVQLQAFMERSWDGVYAADEDGID